MSIEHRHAPTRAWAEKLSTELLHTLKQKRAAVIRLRCLETFGIMACSYCGHILHLGGLPKDERDRLLVEHIMTCEKRPERRLLGVAAAAARVVEAFENPDRDAGYEAHSAALIALKAELATLDAPQAAPLECPHA